MSGGPTSGGPFRFSLPAAKAADPVVLDELKALFEDHRGESDVHFVVEMSDGPKKLCFGEKYKVQQSPNLRYEIEQLLGADALAA
jgi:hypothetical protein